MGPTTITIILPTFLHIPSLPLSPPNRREALLREDVNALPLPLVLLLLLLHLLPPQALSLNQDGLYLLQAKRALSDPAAALSSWNPRDSTPCNWTGVTCDPPSSGRVSSVELPGSQLAGPFPIILCRLPGLSTLNLSDNFINASLPSAISACQSLIELDLSQNLLAGSVPGSLSNLPVLRHLDLSYNSFTDIEPGLGESPRLESLWLLFNLLGSTVPAFLSNISTLKTLKLAYNPFTPSHIPSQLGNLTQLEILWLSDCNLVGEIPDSLGKLPRLSNLDLCRNRLTGPIPSSLTGLKSIYQIELYNNSLSGELPSGWSNTTTLRLFDVSTNELTGTIPVDLCDLPLSSLNLFENRLEGTLPEGIAKSENLYELKLFNNRFSGPLPSDLGKNSPLQSLDLSYNQFSGRIPENLCAGGRLLDLVFIYNNFSGPIPSSLGQCTSLNRIRLKHNRFSGSVPDGVWGLPRVSLFQISENELSGQVSSSISGAGNLSVLDISDNLFSGSLPHEIGSLQSLMGLYGSNNNLTGQIPDSMVDLMELSTLDLSSNGLSGEIPEGIKSWKMLNELNLANNRLSGRIPAEIGSLPVLNYLDLSRNRLSGNIPLELQNLKLNVLNLSNNQFSGDLPPMYMEDVYRNNFLGNPGLCGDLPGLCPKKTENRNLKYLWVLSLTFVLAGIVFVVGVAWFCCRYRTLKKSTKKGMAITKWRSFHKLGFSELEIIDCLREDNLIGSGASGKVYKVELTKGEVVAVKKLRKATKRENEMFGSEKDGFQVEVETLGKIRHKNIVRLWCCCNNGDSKMLVYEYMPNGSLGDMLHGPKGGALEWPVRYRIALDAADGLSYLHHDCVPPIVHRDVKSNNILLDGEFGAKVADFGLAKIVRVGKGDESMSVIAGSYGYIAPEYAYTLRVNEKSDTYSFGVVILELVTGKPPIHPSFGDKDLVRWVCTTLDEQGVDLVIDPIIDPVHWDEASRVLDIGLRCTNSLPINRPSMRKVVKMLQEAGIRNSKLKTVKKDGKLSPYYYEDVSDP